MTQSVKIKAESKEKNGKGSARAARREDRVPGILYGGANNKMVSFVKKEIEKEFQKGNILSRLFEIELEGKTIAAIPRAVQLHPVKDNLLHIDLQEVDVKKQAKIPLHVKIINEDKSPGLKVGGVMNVPHRFIHMMCMPTSIPDHIVVDLAGLQIGHSIHINDIKLPEDVVPVDKANFVLVSVTGRTAEKEEVATEGAATTAEASKA